MVVVYIAANDVVTSLCFPWLQMELGGLRQQVKDLLGSLNSEKQKTAHLEISFVEVMELKQHEVGCPHSVPTVCLSLMWPDPVKWGWRRPFKNGGAKDEGLATHNVC